MELKSNGQYRIELNDVINNSTITEEDLHDVYGEKIELHLTSASRKVYSILYSAYKGWEIEQQVKELHYIINNDTTKQEAIRDAIIEFIQGAVISGLDLNEYVNNEKYYANSVRDILHENGLWIKATIEATEDLRA